MLPVFVAVFGFIALFIACELGQRTTDAFDGINDKIDQLNWYLFPIEIQRTLPMILANAQEPVTFECFGSFNCTREVFKIVSFRKIDKLIGNSLLILLLRHA